VGANGTGFISRRNARLLGLDNLTMDYIWTKAEADHKSPAQIIMEEEVIITRKDGNRFKLVPIAKKTRKSPFDIEGIDTDITTQEVLDIIRECREGSDYFKNK
jgi:hypothetical protein